MIGKQQDYTEQVGKGRGFRIGRQSKVSERWHLPAWCLPGLALPPWNSTTTGNAGQPGFFLSSLSHPVDTSLPPPFTGDSELLDPKGRR